MSPQAPTRTRPKECSSSSQTPIPLHQVMRDGCSYHKGSRSRRRLDPSRKWRSEPPFKEIVRSRCFNIARCRCAMNEAVIVSTAAAVQSHRELTYPTRSGVTYQRSTNCEVVRTTLWVAAVLDKVIPALRFAVTATLLFRRCTLPREAPRPR